MNLRKSVVSGALLASVVLSFSAYAAGGLSLTTLTGLLNGGTQALGAKSMSNAAGVMEYCLKKKVVAATDPEALKGKLKDKLGLNDGKNTQQDEDYKNGLLGILKTGDKQIDLNNLGSSAVAEKVKVKACDVALKQGINYIK